MRLPSPEQRRFYARAVSVYEAQLGDHTGAQEYLTTRGISLQVAATYRLGVVHEPLVGHEEYQGRLAIPYMTPAGAVNFTFRCIRPECARCASEEHPKYKAALLERNIYNVLDLGTPSQVLHVTEGELDALTLSMCGFPAVGIPGASSWKPQWTLCLADYAEVYVWGDGDTAGRAFAREMEKRIAARRVAVPYGMDVNRVFLEGGADALHKCVGF